MNFLRFIKWWWNKRSDLGKIAIGFWSYLILMVIGVFIWGPKIFDIFILSMVVFAFGYLIKMIWDHFYKQWNKFHEEREEEAKEIMNRLGGTDGDFDKDVARMIQNRRTSHPFGGRRKEP